MAHSEIMQKIEDLSEERKRLLAREGSPRGRGRPPEARGHRSHPGRAVGFSATELAGEYVRLDQNYFDRYAVSPGDDAPDGYRR